MPELYRPSLDDEEHATFPLRRLLQHVDGAAYAGQLSITVFGSVCAHIPNRGITGATTSSCRRNRPQVAMSANRVGARA